MSMKLSRLAFFLFFFFRNPNISKSTGQYPDIHELYHCLHLLRISKNKTAVPQPCTKYLGEQDIVWAFRAVSLSFRSIPMTVLAGITEAFKICFNTWQRESVLISLLFQKFVGSSCLFSLSFKITLSSCPQNVADTKVHPPAALSRMGLWPICEDCMDTF